MLAIVRSDRPLRARRETKTIADAVRNHRRLSLSALANELAHALVEVDHPVGVPERPLLRESQNQQPEKHAREDAPERRSVLRGLACRGRRLPRRRRRLGTPFEGDRLLNSAMMPDAPSVSKLVTNELQDEL